MASNSKELVYSVYTIDSDDYILEIDNNFTNITGYTKKDIKNNKLNQSDLIFADDLADYFKMVRKGIKKKNEIFMEHRIKRKDGVGIFVFCLGVKQSDNTCQIRITDISDTLCVKKNAEEVSKKYNKKLKELVTQATTDSLTGLLRRDTFEYKVNNYLKNKVSTAFVMFDVDNFKNINDTYGHDLGDRILKNVASIIRETIADAGVVCRLGGDEFSAVIVNITKKKDVTDYLDLIRERIAKVHIREDKNFKVTLSIGVKVVTNYKKEYHFNDLYLSADKALYKSKNNGKDQYNF